jgi:hypothetical protein
MATRGQWLRAAACLAACAVIGAPAVIGTPVAAHPDDRGFEHFVILSQIPMDRLQALPLNWGRPGS